ncbi:hypothetical protein HYS30_01800 [Candidatus Peregrinibacteria bacterium]|nr:hypothetical protein [Candidatus Peregrinibacteria bacterium]MBI2117803.1 hypothetical protein [Candidatus Peregrinibacteria bacterium]MBI2524050.1 hypothetical protein [Candidatus Peregrinibacteria bacterium]
MSAVIATCFTISLLLGNLCPMQLLAYAALSPTVRAKEMTMTPVQGELMACKRRPSSPQSITLTIPSQNACSSGHCLAKGDPTVWLQLSTQKPPTILTSIAWSPLHPVTATTFTTFSLNKNSSIGPPLDHLKTIVLRV